MTLEEAEVKPPLPKTSRRSHERASITGRSSGAAKLAESAQEAEKEKLERQRLEKREARRRKLAAEKRKSSKEKAEWLAQFENYDPEDPPWAVLQWSQQYVSWFTLKLLNPDIERNRRVDKVMLNVQAELADQHVPDTILEALRSKLKAMTLQNAQPHERPAQPLILWSPLDRERERLRKLYPDWNIDGEDIHDLLDKEMDLKNDGDLP